METNVGIDIWDSEQSIADIKRVFAPNLTDTEFKFFLGLGKATGLNPFCREIWSVKYGSGPAQVFIGRDGYRKVALNHPDYDYHQCDAVYENDSFEVVSGEVRHTYNMKDRGSIVGAYCITKRRRASKSVYHFVRMGEYSTGKSLWASKPEVMIKKCFDDQTEILTENGFEKFSSVTGKVMQVTDSGIEPVSATPFHQDYSDDMYLYDSNRLNFCVTPNHNMITSDGEKTAEDLFLKANTSRRRCDSIYFNKDFHRDDYAGISDGQLMLCGYFMADGSKTQMRKSFTIRVSRERKIESLDRLNLHHTKEVKKGVGYVVNTKYRDIRTLSDYECYSYYYKTIEDLCERDGPIKKEFIFKLSPRQIRLLIDSWCEFDGHEKKNGSKRLYSSRIDFIKTAELLCILAGYTISPLEKRIADLSHRYNYSINIVKSKKQDVVTHIARKHAFKKVSNTSGKVWCVTVPSGKIIVRRNGFSMICGNCAESTALRATFQEVLGGTYTPEEMPEEMSVQKKPVISQTDKLKKILESKNVVNRIHSDAHTCSDDVSDTDVGNVPNLISHTAATNAQVNKIYSLIKEKGFSDDRVFKALSYYKVNSFSEMTFDAAQGFLSRLEEISC